MKKTSILGTFGTKRRSYPRSYDRDGIRNQPNSPTTKLCKGKLFVDEHCQVLGDGTGDDILPEWWPEGLEHPTGSFC